ncbi:SOS response-associated peptidase [Sulfurimonas sp. HSL-1656]|uniref:SOS response-associated peptidase n=1 Tax=Thiomicrolovo subterrani TaxID=3131934 RepID=UPI0031F95781
MCGRIGFFDDTNWKDALQASHIQYRDDIGTLRPSYNIAPTQLMATLMNTGVYAYTHFGLIPHWAKDAKFQPINARAESVTQKSTFKGPIRYKRCLVPVNGFYEWQRTDTGKVPYWITSSESSLIALAGIYDEWLGPDGIVIGTAVITTVPNDVMRPIHDRMPVILQQDDWRFWLDPKVTEPDALQPMLVPYGPALMVTKVSTYVNSPEHNDPKCISPSLYK